MNNKNILKITIVLSIIIFIILLIFPFETSNIKRLDKQKTALEKLEYNDTLVEEFVAEDNYISIGFEYANFSRMIENGKILITIENSLGEEKKYEVDANTLLDNYVFYINYDFNKGEKYRLTIVDNVKDNITFYSSIEDIEETDFYVNNELQNVDLFLYFEKQSKNYKTIWYFLMIITIIISIEVLYVGGNKNEK